MSVDRVQRFPSESQGPGFRERVMEPTEIQSQNREKVEVEVLERERGRRLLEEVPPL